MRSLALRHPFHLGLLWHLSDTSIHPRPPALIHVSMLHLTNPCTELKGSQPNQRHEPKSLGYRNPLVTKVVNLYLTCIYILNFHPNYPTIWFKFIWFCLKMCLSQVNVFFFFCKETMIYEYTWHTINVWTHIGTHQRERNTECKQAKFSSKLCHTLWGVWLYIYACVCVLVNTAWWNKLFIFFMFMIIKVVNL